MTLILLEIIKRREEQFCADELSVWLMRGAQLLQFTGAKTQLGLAWTSIVVNHHFIVILDILAADHRENIASVLTQWISWNILDCFNSKVCLAQLHMPNRSFVFSNGIFFVGLLDLAISGSEWIIDNVRCRSILLMWLGLQNIIIIISLVQNTNNLLLSIIYNLLLRLHCKAFNLQILKWHKFSILNVCGWAISGCKNRLLDYFFNSRLIANTASIANFIKAESMNSCFAKSALEVFFGNSTENSWQHNIS